MEGKRQIRKRGRNKDEAEENAMTESKQGLPLLASIVFNGWALKKVVLFKKDVVLLNRPRIRDFQVCAGVPKWFRKLTDTDVNRSSF